MSDASTLNTSDCHSQSMSSASCLCINPQRWMS